MPKFLMIQGTSSDAGKSMLVMALCRIFADEGIRVAPFKAQNMSSNADIIDDGMEIAKAQSLQALAARTRASVEMNPILLKPLGNYLSRVIVLGKEYSIMHARDYYNNFILKEGLTYVLSAIERLSQDYELIIIEGAGSPAEINLQEYDIANMRLAEMISANVLIISDIERGGSFASMLGTLELIERRDLVRGFIINRFRGDIDILKPAIDIFEKISKKPILGVIPYIDDLRLAREDTLSMKRADDPDALVIRYPTARDLAEIDSLGLRLSYIDDNRVMDADLIILPPSRDLVADLEWMEANGIADWIRYASKKGSNIIGIDEGYGMLARSIDGYKGLGVLDLSLTNKKRIGRYGMFNGKRCFINIHFDTSIGDDALVGIVDDREIVIGIKRRNIIGYTAYGLLREMIKMVGIEKREILDEEIDRVARIVKDSIDINGIKKMMELGC